LDERTSQPIAEDHIHPEIVIRAVHTVVVAKKINPKYHPGFSDQLAYCIEAIYGYKRLVTLIDQMRLEPYDCENHVHEHKLKALWHNLMPDVELEARITKQWQEIGFQGDDP
jgi:hypothetical protein